MVDIALIGAGRIGKIHGGNLARQAGMRLRYVCDAVPQAASELAARLGATVASLDQVFADAAIQAVAIASSTDTDAELILGGASARKAICCEKPVDLDLGRAREVQAAVATARVPCLIGFQRRHDPPFAALKRRLDAGEIGEVEILSIPSRDPAPPPIAYIERSGGIFKDQLIHDFDVCRWIIGDEAQTVYAASSCLVDPAIAAAGDIDTAAVTIRTRRGRLCQINTSRRAAYGYDQRFEVLGSKGLLACGNQRPTEVTQADAAGTRADNPEHFFLQRYREAYRLEVTHFFEQLQSGGAFRTTVEDGVAAQRLADAAAQSLATGQPVSFD